MHVFDLVGVFAFATFGAYQALLHEFNTFGVVLCAFLTALGGGTIREVILNHQPTYFHNNAYLIATLAGATFALLVDHWFPAIERGMLALDAVGLVIFAFIGAERAGAAGLGLAPMELFAILTACGGGILTDLVCRQRPTVCHKGSYTVVPLLTGAGYWLLRAHMGTAVWAGGFLLLLYAIRITYLYGQPLLRVVTSAYTTKERANPHAGPKEITSFVE
jgi:uncharacterized membrane protein YeiH